MLLIQFCFINYLEHIAFSSIFVENPLKSIPTVHVTCCLSIMHSERIANEKCHVYVIAEIVFDNKKKEKKNLHFVRCLYSICFYFVCCTDAK